MNTNYGFGGDEVREESTWRYAIGIVLATLILCAIFLYIYVGPSVDEINGSVPSPTMSEDKVRFSVSGHPFEVRANYTVFPRERRGGSLGGMSLYALWPAMSGYSNAFKLEFIDNAADTRRINIEINQRRTAFTEVDRIETIYLPLTVDQRGTRTPYRLNRYTFRQERDTVPTNGYADTDLFIGQDSDGNTMALFCHDDDLATIPSPECRREYELNGDLTVTYRFKRPYLAEWKEIDTRVRAFLDDLSTTQSRTSRNIKSR
ncbi:MAG: hypothetical protein AAGL18_08120 [Pseudomonadota bacterium]